MPQSAQAEFSLAADFESAPIDVSGFSQGNIHIIWTGAVGTDGAAKIQASADGQNWNDYGSDRTVLTIDEAENIQLFLITVFGGRFIRLKYTANTMSAGTAQMFFSAEVRN